MLGLLGAALLAAAVALASARTGRPRYRRRSMAGPDWAMAAAALAAPLLIGGLALGGDSSLVWRASPLRWPTFDPLVALALVPLLAPMARGSAVGSPLARPRQVELVVDP